MIYSAPEARWSSLQKLLGERKAYLCDVEFSEQIQRWLSRLRPTMVRSTG